ncbi:MAG: SDR family oxidoreductase, partial [Candidatus Cloacimonetes bacterium]|nr:SDR family oxidoreductase [Candidatus Cloacimonadota bacterium]
KKIIAEFGTIDILVCNAGGPPSGSIENFSVADFRKALELNLISTINLCTEIYPFLQKNRWGRIVAITSVSAKQPIDNLVLSNTARSGVTGYIKTLSNHLASFGITVNSICPGYTKTERVEQLAEAFEQNGKGSVSTFYRNIENSIPMKRLGTTEEFAKTVAFLVSEGAGYITGSALQVDGGFVKNIL